MEAGNIVQVEIDKIVANPRQPRKNFIESSLIELANSISEYGVLQPVIVRQTDNGKYILISGERRLRASVMAGEKTIPALIRNEKLIDMAIMALVENLQREEISFMEEAEAYYELLKDGLTQEEIAEKVGKSQSAVSNKIRLLRLPEKVKAKIRRYGLSERHARALLRLPDAVMQALAADEIIERHYTVQQTDEFIACILSKKCSPVVAEEGGEDKVEKYCTNEEAVSYSVKQMTSAKQLVVGILKKMYSDIVTAVNSAARSGVIILSATRDTEECFEYCVRVPKGKNGLEGTAINIISKPKKG